jgi:AI-2 transport protein TqsA
MKTNKIASTLVICMATVVILIYLKSILVPFVFAVIVWFLIKEVKTLMTKSKFVRKTFPSWLLNLLASIAIFGVISLFTNLLVANAKDMIAASETYKANIMELVHSIDVWLGIDLIADLKQIINEMDFGEMIKGAANSLSTALGDIFIIIIYVLFLIAEESVTPKKLRMLYPTRERFHGVHVMLNEINKSIGKYLALKTMVSILTGVLSWIVLRLVGVDFPVFWAIVIFLLNFIPTIGSLIGTVLLTLMALLQFGEFIPATIVLVAVGTIQVVIGSIIEPKIMSDSLNISSLVVMLSLAFWGFIWGVVGMILCVPIMVMLIIILGRFESTKPVAILLSGNGNV